MQENTKPHTDKSWPFPTSLSGIRTRRGKMCYWDEVNSDFSHYHDIMLNVLDTMIRIFHKKREGKKTENVYLCQWLFSWIYSNIFIFAVDTVWPTITSTQSVMFQCVITNKTIDSKHKHTLCLEKHLFNNTWLKEEDVSFHFWHFICQRRTWSLKTHYLHAKTNGFGMKPVIILRLNHSIKQAFTLLTRTCPQANSHRRSLPVTK